MPSRAKGEVETVLLKGLGSPALRALASVGVHRLDQVTRFSETELLALHGMGPKALGIIKAALRAQGKSLARDR